MVGPVAGPPLMISTEYVRPSLRKGQTILRIDHVLRTKKPKEDISITSSDFTTSAQMAELPNEVLAIIFSLLWRSWRYAPRLDVVCTTFRNVSRECAGNIHYKLLAAPGAVLKLAPLAPYLVADGLYTSTLQALGGPGLADFQAFWALGERVAKRRMLQSDLSSLLDVPTTGRRNGWLMNIAIDAFLSTLFPDAMDAVEPGPKYLSSPMLLRDSEGKYAWNESNDSTCAWRNNMSNANELHGVYNVGPNVHWVYFIIDMTKERLTFFESSNFVTEAEGKALLAALASALSIPACIVKQWPVYIVKKGVLEQFDSKSCGVYACIFAYAYKHSRKLPHITPAKLRDWRAFIARTIQDPAD